MKCLVNRFSWKLITSQKKLNYITSYSIQKRHRNQFTNLKNLSMAYENITEPAIFKGINKWILFSDLHVSEKSIETCIGVLRKIREEARQKDAGILFLGDFWHHRGILHVPTLNLILDELKIWDIPTIMLTGNHDQVQFSSYFKLTHKLG